MELKKGDRVFLLKDITKPVLVKDKTVCTVVSLLDQQSVIIRYGYDEKHDRDLVIGVPIVDLNKITDKIKQKDSYFVSSSYHIGHKFIVSCNVFFDDEDKSGKIATIIDFNLALNEQDDSFLFDIEGEHFEFSKDFIDVNFERYIPLFHDKMGKQETEEDKSDELVNGLRVIFSFGNNSWKRKYIGNIVKYNDGTYSVEDLNGNFYDIYGEIAFDAKELKQHIEFFNNEKELNEYIDGLMQELVCSNCLPGKKFRASPNIESNFLLKSIFHPNDVIKILDYKYHLNKYDDVFTVLKNDLTKEKISFFELSKYFEPINEIINSNDINQTEQIEQTEQTDLIKLSNSKIKIHSLSVGQFEFFLMDQVIESLSTITYENLSEYIDALDELKNFIEK